MNARRKVLLGLLAAWSGLVCGGVVLAGVPDSRFDVSPDGVNVDFDVRDAPRRDVLSRLFAGTGTEIRWADASFADERISGQFSGSPSAVARRLLAQANFVLVHDAGDEGPRVIRVLVVGPAQADQSAARAAIAAGVPALGTPAPAAPAGAPKPPMLAAPDRAPAAQPRPADAPPPPAPRGVASTEPAMTGDAGGFMRPPTPGAAAPQPGADSVPSRISQQ